MAVSVSSLRAGLRVAASHEMVGAGLPVLRALPTEGLDCVGPFVFLDHVGPIVAPTRGVPAHPHAGIEVISYSLSGEIHHRDSFGHQGRVGPGGAQFITSGSGMLHAEQPVGTPGESGPATMHGVQLWTRHPAALDDAPARYAAITAEAIPQAAHGGVTVRLLCGTLADLPIGEGPVTLAQPSLLAHLHLAAGARLTLTMPADFELAAYALTGAPGVESAVLARGELLTLPGGTALTFAAEAPADLLLLGGEPLEAPPVFGGPFVFGSEARVRQAYRDYAAGRMGHLDGVP